MKKRSLLFASARAKILFIAVLSSASLLTFAQGKFQKAIGVEGFEKGSVLKQLPDGGFIIGGETQSYGLTETDMLLIRTDANGNVQWTQTYGGPEREVINDVVQMPDRGFLFLAERYQPDKKEGEFLTLGKTDASGKLLWKKIHDEGGNETEGFSMSATPDGNYIITGITRKLNVVSTAFFNLADRDPKLFLLKVDGSGNKMWSRCLNLPSGNISSTGNSVIIGSDGSYIITGNVTKEESSGNKTSEDAGDNEARNMLLVKVKADGSFLWANEYGANRVTAGFKVIEKKEGGFMVVGIATPDKTNNVDYFMMSVAADGVHQWSKTFGGAKFDAVSDVAQAADGGFIVSGSTNSYGAGASDVLLFKTDNNGNVQWSKTYGGQSGEYGAQIAQAADGSIALTGQVSMGKESYDVLLLKTDSNGNSGCLGTTVPLVGKNFPVTSKKITSASTVGIEPGDNPNYKKPDANNIAQQQREVRAKNVCQ